MFCFVIALGHINYYYIRPLLLSQSYVIFILHKIDYRKSFPDFFSPGFHRNENSDEIKVMNFGILVSFLFLFFQFRGTTDIQLGA